MATSLRTQEQGLNLGLDFETPAWLSTDEAVGWIVDIVKVIFMLASAAVIVLTTIFLGWLIGPPIVDFVVGFYNAVVMIVVFVVENPILLGFLALPALGFGHKWLPVVGEWWEY